MNGHVATRNTCFALISAIEDDFRALCIALGDQDQLLPEDVRQVARKRRQIDLRMEEGSASTDADLLPYIDFADIAKIIESKIAPRQEQHRQWLVTTAKMLLALTAARNRVCHTRPLETDDLPGFVDLSDYLLAPASPYPFTMVSSARARLREEPGFVLTLQIPAFWNEKAKIHHNLPIPEFDDTGFVGRQGDRLQVLKLLKSHYPIVTIVGEGGIGKTALALRCLYDVVEDPTSFDAIIWVSLKTTALTAAGVRQLNGAITSTLGLLSEVAKNLGGPSSGATEQEYIDEIAEYLGLYRILIAIDNLETVSIGPLRDLLLRVPPTSKILLTSRIGLGEFEARYPLQGLEEKAAVTLTRAHARVLGVTAILKLDDGNLKGYCKKLFFNPLLIKWFVASVGRGADANALVNKAGEDFATAISFCFRNLYERLGDAERSVIACLASARRPLTSAELHFLMPELSTLQLEVALIALHNSSIVVRSKKGSEGFEYSLSESTIAFVSRQAPPSAEFFREVQNRLHDLRIVLTQESILEARYDYDPFFVRSGEGRDERICATYLRRALDCTRRSDFAQARVEVEEAQRLAPQSGEVWRIAALIEELAGDYYRAYQFYVDAVELAPTSRITRYEFGMFLMQDMHELEGALLQFEEAIKLDPGNPTLLTAKAMALMRTGQFSAAAEIHEGLLLTIKVRERRWRLSGVDQAADCYKRWGFRAWEQKEYETAKRYFVRAMSIITESAERGDLDDKLLERTARVISEALGRRELLDAQFVNSVIDAAETIGGLSSRQSIPISSHAAYALKHLEGTPDHDRLLALDRSFVNAEAITAALGVPSNFAIADGRRRGNIHNLQPSFGFIVENDGARWFFHRNHLMLGMQWDHLRPGLLVSFSIGQNEKGECAVDVGPG